MPKRRQVDIIATGHVRVSHPVKWNASCPLHLILEGQVDESNPSTSGALEKSKYRGPGVPLWRMPGERTSSFGGSNTCAGARMNASTRLLTLVLPVYQPRQLPPSAVAVGCLSRFVWAIHYNIVQRELLGEPQGERVVYRKLASDCVVSEPSQAEVVCSWGTIVTTNSVWTTPTEPGSSQRYFNSHVGSYEG